jgi:hypothetical protein
MNTDFFKSSDEVLLSIAVFIENDIFVFTKFMLCHFGEKNHL